MINYDTLRCKFSTILIERVQILLFNSTESVSRTNIFHHYFICILKILEEQTEGVQPTKSDPEPVMPKRWDPFNERNLHTGVPLTGDAVFCSEGAWPTGLWAERSGKEVLDLTYGFEDNFIDVWNSASNDKQDTNDEGAKSIGPLADLLGENLIFDDIDPVFKTVAGELT